MGKLMNTILGVIGLQLAEEGAKQEASQTEDQEIIVDGILQQEPGTLTTLNPSEVSLAVINNGSEIEVTRRDEPKIPRARRMGGEEIQPGTLH